MKQYLLVLLVVLLVGCSSSMEKAPVRGTLTEASLSVSDQSVITGGSVTGIAGYAKEPAFVVVKTVDKGSDGVLLGASPQVTGAFSAMSIGVSGVPTSKLLIGVYKDSNGNGAYDQADQKYLSSGQVVKRVISVVKQQEIKSAASSTSTKSTTTSSTASTESAQPAPVSGDIIEITGFAMKPTVLQVNSGSKITWVNKDIAPQSVQGINGPAPFASPTLKKGESYTYAVPAAGTYTYENVPYGSKGTIIAR
jgi:plastocyanin